MLLEVIAKPGIDTPGIAISGRECVIARSVVRRERVAALIEAAGQRVIALLQALIALRRGLLGRVVAEKIE